MELFSLYSLSGGVPQVTLNLSLESKLLLCNFLLGEKLEKLVDTLLSCMNVSMSTMLQNLLTAPRINSFSFAKQLLFHREKERQEKKLIN